MQKPRNQAILRIPGLLHFMRQLLLRNRSQGDGFHFKPGAEGQILDRKAAPGRPAQMGPPRNRPHCHIGVYPVRRRPAQDPLRQNHAPDFAKNRFGPSGRTRRSDNSGRSGRHRSAGGGNRAPYRQKRFQRRPGYPEQGSAYDNPVVTAQADL